MGFWKSMLGGGGAPKRNRRNRKQVTPWGDGATVIRVRSGAYVYVVHPWSGAFQGCRHLPWEIAWFEGDSVLEYNVVSFIKSVRSGSTDDNNPGIAEDVQFRSRYPALFEYLTATAMPDGSPRRTSSLTVFADAGTWKAVMNERQEDLALWVSAESVEGLLEALDELLQTDRPPWRMDGKRQKGNSRK